MHQLDGIHHITATTGDAPRNVDFYVRVLGLRMVKKTVNQDDPSVYHLFYADEQGSPGADLTFFEYPGARQGVAGDGMVHTVAWRVAGEAALDFWAARLSGEGVEVARVDDAGARGTNAGLRFCDAEGLGLELVAGDEGRGDALTARADEIPAEHALQGFAGVRVYAGNPEASAPVFEDVLGFTRDESLPGLWTVASESRSSWYVQEAPPAGVRGVQGAGVVHHVAFSTLQEDQELWHRQVLAAGLRPSPVIDRFWFRSIYFLEPSGTLFELATTGPGFAIDEDAESLGEQLVLPPKFEPMRERIEQVLTPLPVTTATTRG